MQQAFINAFLYPSFTCMGKSLLPLTLGHLFILDIVKSPFAIGGDIGIDDLLTAIFICSNDWKSNVDYLNNQKEMAYQIALWSKQLYTKKLFHKKPSVNFEYELAIFRQYINYFSVFPRRWETEGMKKPSKLPWQVSVMFMLTPKWNEQDLWNMPITKVMALVACYETSQGDNNLASEAEAELLDKWALEDKGNDNG